MLCLLSCGAAAQTGELASALNEVIKGKRARVGGAVILNGEDTVTVNNDCRQLIAVNDAGFVHLPDGRHYAVAVFIKDSEETGPVTAQLIADISEVVYRYVAGKTIGGGSSEY